ncbi:MAG: hypothetical protein H0W82_02475 [Actinobacteria bacterium]|nr:hypothetical protein [Actinomycetota bacterium]
MRRKLRAVRAPIVAAALLAALALPSAVAVAGTGDTTSMNYRANLRAVPLNPPASGTARIDRVGNVITVDVHVTGLTPLLKHAMHIHGDLRARNECPPASADVSTGDQLDPANFTAGVPDGLLSVSEGAPFYGPVQVSFTTDPNPTTSAVGFNVELFPAANNRGVLDYHRTFQIPGKIAAKLGQLHVVVHGEDLNGDGAYSDFMEASLPVACGVIDPA